MAFLVVSNAGAAGLVGTATVLPGDFELLAGTPFSLDPASSTNLEVRFAPNTSGVFTNIVTFVSNGGGSLNALKGRALTAPIIQVLPFNGTSFAFTFPSVFGFTYDVQYKDSIIDTNWLPLTSVPGDGATKTVAVPITSPSNRFYRLRVE